MFDDDDYEHNCKECGEPCDCGDTSEYCDMCNDCYDSEADLID